MTSGCPVCGFDGSRLSPSDGAVALRSFPRRITLVLARPDDEDRPDDVVHRRPSGRGSSAVEHGAWMAAGIAQAGRALRSVMYLDDPEISPPPLDVDPPAAGGELRVDEVIGAIREAADGLASAIGDAPSDGWTRTGRAADGALSALDLVRLAVHLGVHQLRQASRVVDEVARDSR